MTLRTGSGRSGIAVTIVIGLLIIFGACSTPPTPSSNNAPSYAVTSRTPSPSPTVKPTPGFNFGTQTAKRAEKQALNSSRSTAVDTDDDPSIAGTGDDDDDYVNSDGESVHRPEFDEDAPDGATARCRDGSYSFSRHHRGTCSHHGGVAQWL
jgi:Protein of unknown function (DUF3761)